MIQRLTWDGHDFLDAIRSKSVWNKTKDAVGSSGFQSVPFVLLKEAAMSTMREQLPLG